MKLYAVGGAVRDHLRGLKGKDLDFAVEAESFDAMMDALRARGMEVWQSRPEYVTVRGRMPLSSLGTFGGILTAHLPERGKSLPLFVAADFTLCDFTLCRKEAQYSDKRHPDTVTPADILTDLSRRDFTMNAIAVDEAGHIIDPHNGMADINAHTIRTVGNPPTRFAEDPLRILRAIRFAVTLEFWIDMYTREWMNDPWVVEGLGTLPFERIVNELRIPLAQNWRATMIELLISSPRVGAMLARKFPGMWLKPTTEER